MRYIAKLSVALILFGTSLSCSAQTVCPIDCTCPGDGSVTCSASAATVANHPELCCPGGQPPNPFCYPNCANCSDPTDPTCCDVAIRGYLCNCVGPLSSATGPLAYYLLALTYEPPGNLSTDQYLNGTSIGSQVMIQVTSAGGAIAQVTGPTFQVSGSYLYGTISGDAFQVTSNGSWGPQVTSNTDLINHLNDKFWIWTNPEMTASTQDNNYTVSIQPPSGQLINVLDVTLGELVGLVSLPGYKAAQLANLTDADKAAIIRTNPYLASLTGDINPTPLLDPNRFTFLKEHFQVNGPDHPGDPPSGIAIDTNTQNIHGTIQGYMHQAMYSIQLGGSVAFITMASAFAGIQYQYTYQKTTQSNTGTITDAQGLLESNTTCWHQGVDLYWDGAFGTYLFQPTDGGSSNCNDRPASMGVVKNMNGRPVANILVTGKLANGTIWRTTSNAHGVFKFYHLPARAKGVFHVSVPKGYVVRIVLGPRH